MVLKKLKFKKNINQSIQFLQREKHIKLFKKITIYQLTLYFFSLAIKNQPSLNYFFLLNKKE